MIRLRHEEIYKKTSVKRGWLHEINDFSFEISLSLLHNVPPGARPLQQLCRLSEGVHDVSFLCELLYQIWFGLMAVHTMKKVKICHSSKFYTVSYKKGW